MKRRRRIKFEWNLYDIKLSLCFKIGSFSSCMCTHYGHRTTCVCAGISSLLKGCAAATSVSTEHVFKLFKMTSNISIVCAGWCCHEVCVEVKEQLMGLLSFLRVDLKG